MLLYRENKSKESPLAVEADTSEDGTQVHLSLGGWPWESTNSWELPLFVLAKHKIVLSLRTDLRIRNNIHKAVLGRM